MDRFFSNLSVLYYPGNLIPGMADDVVHCVNLYAVISSPMLTGFFQPILVTANFLVGPFSERPHHWGSQPSVL